MYGSLASLTNVTSNSVWVYLKLFAVSDANQRRLVRTKMSSIFRPAVRRAINQVAVDSSQGIFSSVPKVLEALKETKDINTLISQNLNESKKTGKGANKAGKNKDKKPAAGGSNVKNEAKSSRKKVGGSKSKVKNDSSGTKEKEDFSIKKTKDELCN